MTPPGQERRLQITPGLRRLTAYPKFRDDVPRILVLQSRFGMDRGCINAAAQLNWPVHSVPAAHEGGLEEEAMSRLFEALCEFKPDFVLNVNLGGMDGLGLCAHLFHDLRIPCATWFVDNPRTIRLGEGVFAHEFAAAFTWERAYIPYLEAKGYRFVEYLPLALDPTLFYDGPVREAGGPPAFIGSSMVERTRREREWIDGRPDLAEAIDGAFREGRVNRAAYGEGLDAIFDSTVAGTLDEDGRWHAEVYLFYEGTRRLREALASTLGAKGVVFHGDPDWRRYTAHAGGPVDYDRDLKDFYRRSAVNINQTCIQMPAAVNQRVFDCPGAGGFLLTDAQGDLFELFDPGKELALYSTPEECLDRLSWFLDHPEERERLTRNAQERIEKNHLYTDRLQTLASAMKARFQS